MRQMRMWTVALMFSALVGGTSVAQVNYIDTQFVWTCGIAKYEKPYQDAKACIKLNTRQDIVGGTPQSTFHAGVKWNTVWNRDGCYSIELACGHLDSATSANTMKYITENKAGYGVVQLQDVCGHFGGWPMLTDGMTYATGTWAYIRQTGDTAFIKTAYGNIRRSLKMAENDAQDKTDGLFKGCSSFMESNSGYPQEFAGRKTIIPGQNSVGNSKAGSTNMLYYVGYANAAKMAAYLGSRLGSKWQDSVNELNQKAAALRTAINTHLWNASKGYYYYFKYANGTKHINNEGLAGAYAILFDVADSAQKLSILKNTIPTAWGHVCQYPQYPEWCPYKTSATAPSELYYHNYMVWPFVNGYLAWAAAKMKDADFFMNNMSNCALLWNRTQGGFLTVFNSVNDVKMTGQWHEYYIPDQAAGFTVTGVPGKTGGPQQLWSAAGYIAMVFRGLFGMNFELDGIHFNPMVPDTFKTAMTLKNFKYRGMRLNIRVKNPGRYLDTFKLDGVLKSRGKGFVSSSLTGTREVYMTMSDTYVPPVDVTGIIPQGALAVSAIRVTSQLSRDAIAISFGDRQVDAAVLSASGKYLGSLSGSNGVITMRKSAFQPGMYILKWRSGNQIGTHKVFLTF